MIYHLYVYRDRLKSDFSLPMIEINDAVMTRNFENACANEPSMSFNPNDFDLFEIGTFDTASGLFDTHTPEFMVNGGNVV